MNSFEIADFILAKYPDKKITPMKLQKLAYYAKAWSLVAGWELIEVDFLKWRYGPVNRAVYDRFSPLGDSVIDGQFTSPNLSQEVTHLLGFILDNYVDYSAFTLSAMTHHEDPWRKTGDNQVISEQAMLDYYSQQPFARNFVNGQVTKGTYHLLQTGSWHAFTLDMSDEDANLLTTMPSYDAYLDVSKQAARDFDNWLTKLVNG